MSSLLHDVLFPKLSRDQLVACESVPTTSSLQLAKPIESEECKTSCEQSNETLDITKDGKRVKEVSYGKVQPYPLDEKYKYAGRAYIFHDDDCQKNLVEQIEAVTRDTLKLTPIEKRVRGTSDAIQELIQVANTDNFGQEACFFAFVLVNFNWREFNDGVPNLNRAFFSTSCETLASKPKIFIFVDAGRIKFIKRGWCAGLQSDYIEELEYANQHSDMLFFNNGVPNIKRAFFSTSCETLASKPKIFIFVDAGGEKKYLGPRRICLMEVSPSYYIEELGYANQHSDMLFVNNFLLKFLETLSSPGDRDFITLITDAIGNSSEHLQYPKYYCCHEERTSTNDFYEYEDSRQEVKKKITESSTIIDSTLRLPFFCIGNFQHCISEAEVSMKIFMTNLNANA
ncbi:hypothetical protein B566_EDAN017762, partial [Ephemera danica]